MSTSLVWILAPGITAAVLFFLRRQERLAALAGISLAAVLALLAWRLPVGEPIGLGPISLELAETFTVLGRRFVLGSEDRPVLILIYLAATLWFTGSVFARTGPLFIPLGLGIAALLTAALAVEPFLYAALLIEMAVLVSVPLLASPGRLVGRGVLRYLTFQTMGMPFLLLTGSVLAGIEGDPGSPELVTRASFLLSLGFAFLLGIIPFHIWIPMLLEEAHPYSAAFVLFLLPLGISLFGLTFLDSYEWLRTSAGLYGLLRLGGGLMVFIGGLWAAFQRHLGRMMGYAVIVEIGFSLLAVSVGLGAGGDANLLLPFITLLGARGLELGVWGLALAAIQSRSGELRFRAVQGAVRSLPAAVAALMLAHFSLAGFPLLAGFSVHLALWEALAEEFPFIALVTLLGSAGLLTGGLRTLAVMVMGPEEQRWQVLGAGRRPVSESWGERALLILGAAALLFIGLFPQWFLPAISQLGSAIR